MKFIKIFLGMTIIIIAATTLALNKNSAGKDTQTAAQKVRVQIQIIADSSNSLQADVEVPTGTPARDLMERLFKMNYADFARRFVNGIAGFIVSPREKKFWRLEIDGKASEVGIAEIKISKPMQIRWVITAFQ